MYLYGRTLIAYSRYEDAERDCTTTLDIDQKNVKAMYRRAQAREALGKRVEAQLGMTYRISASF